ncbi:zinc-ribbon domain-containing protein [Streptomyces sp. NBC_00140]|uniref:zinc-ribbon domain-containing protein n=1 Tax=Streptomyces sp. NBC_00140 TaxID=2975664 RepID=UPI002256C4B9|nr:zinc-ribbon domain-containing protein [Streptomyces sp. NBC_00140]MCX5328520.1 zinc-ribbon domain-containing protein [Streptomyces sp. NBC_00140]
MLSEHPVAEEFHPTKNAPLAPDQVPYSWKEKVWWQCRKNPQHVWDATPNNRTKKTRPTGCRDCHGKRLNSKVPLERSLQGRFPDIAAELNAQRSGFTAAEVLYGAKTQAWWKCPKPFGHPDYPMPVNSRTNPGQKQGCSYCAGKRLSPERSLASVAPWIADEFLSAVNGTVPEKIFSQDNRRYVWRCSKFPSHRWAASPNNRVGKKSSCPFCSGARVWEANRLGDLRPDLVEEWDVDRNGPLTPWMLSVGSSRKVHWKCPKGADHRWPARVYKRTAGQGCRFCAGHEVSESTSLLALRPDLAAQLDAEKSGISAAELTVGSNQVVHWICPINPEEHTWPAKVLNRTLNGTGCRDCNLPGTSAQEVRLAAELGTVLDVAYDLHTVRTVERVERVDIYVPSLSLILEFDGSYWHETTEEADAAKSRRLRTVVRHVVRIREHPLDCLDPVHDVVVPFQAAPETATAIVVEHLANLDIVPRSALEEYLRLPGPRAADRAEQILADLRTRAREHKLGKEQAEQSSGPPAGDEDQPH